MHALVWLSIDIIKDISNACMEWSVVQLNANATIINEIFSDTIFLGDARASPGFHYATPLLGTPFDSLFEQ
jgi:hypothetical protein